MPSHTNTAKKNNYLSPQKASFLLIAILLFSFFTRIIRIDFPPQYMFDEVYHAVTAKLIAHHDPRAFEWWNEPPEPNTAVDWLHPPLAKYTQAFFMILFGETSFGWRISSVLFGVGVIWLTYRLAKAIFGSEEVGLLAAGLASLDGLLLAQSRIAMNDIHVTFFILLSLLLYWRHREYGETTNWKPLTLQRLTLIGTAVGMALASKWSGIFVLAIIGLFEAWSWIKGWFQLPSLPAKKRPLALVAQIRTALALTSTLIILPLILYIAAYTPMFLQGKTLLCFQEKQIQGQCYFERFKSGETLLYEGYVSHFVALHKQIWWYQTHLDATHPYQSRPWQWFFNLKPVWVHVSYVDQDHVANIYSQGTTMLFWFGGAGVVFAGVAISLFVIQKIAPNLKKQLPHLSKTAAFQLSFLVTAYLMVWFPWVASPRIMFFYHYTPAVPLMSIILAFWLWHLLQDRVAIIRAGAIAMLVLIALNFAIWYPHLTGITMPKKFVDQVYFSLESWK